MAVLKREKETIHFDVDGVKATAIVETAGRLGAWRRDDYRLAARDFVLGKAEFSDAGKPEQMRYLLHLWEGSAVAGSLLSFHVEGKSQDCTPEWFEELPDVVASRLVVESYKRNPQWQPVWNVEADDDADPKEETPAGS